MPILKYILISIFVIVFSSCSTEPKGSRIASDTSNTSIENKTFADAEFDCKTNKSEPNENAGAKIGLQDTPTYTGDIKSLVDKQCISCHNPNGNKPDLTDYAKVKAYADNSLEEMTAGTMPLSGALDTSLVTTFEKWVEAETPEGPANSGSDQGKQNSADDMVNGCL